MDLLNKTKELCRLYGIKPSRSKGQNFLVNSLVYNKIIAAADLKKDDFVLEVGPGLGFLTVRLAQRVKQVVAVELDDKLAAVLETGLLARGINNVEVIQGDILTSPLTPLLIRRGEQKGRGYKIVANLPYNITSVFLRKFLANHPQPLLAKEGSNHPQPLPSTSSGQALAKEGGGLELMVLMLQKEVAARIVAQPPKMSLLAVSVQFYGRPEIVECVGRDNFWPVPEVDSAILRIDTKATKMNEKNENEMDEKKFFQMVKFGFSAKRKMLKNNLAAGYRISAARAGAKLQAAGFNPNIRAQELSVDDWLKLFVYFN